MVSFIFILFYFSFLNQLKFCKKIAGLQKGKHCKKKGTTSIPQQTRQGERLLYRKIVPKGHRSWSGIQRTGHQEMVNCQGASTWRTHRRGLPCNKKAMGHTSMTNKNTSKNRSLMMRQRGKEATERKNRANRVQFVQGHLRPENQPRNKGTTDGRAIVSNRNGKIHNNIMASSISSLIAENATMAGDPTKVDRETQVRCPDKELLSQVKLRVTAYCKSQALQGAQGIGINDGSR